MELSPKRFTQLELNLATSSHNASRFAGPAKRQRPEVRPERAVEALAVPLTPEAMSQDEFNELHDVVVRQRQSYLQVGEALEKIQSGQGYRWLGYDTFEDYCRATLHFSLSRAYQYIDAAKVSTTVESVGGEPPRTERQARPAARLLARADAPLAIKTVLETAGARAAATGTLTRGELVQSVCDELYPDTRRRHRVLKAGSAAASSSMSLEAAVRSESRTDDLGAASSAVLSALARMIAIEPRSFLIALGPGATPATVGLAHQAIDWLSELITQAAEAG